MKNIRENGLGGYNTDSPWSYTYPNLWTWFVKEMGIKSVIDVGCAEGHCLNFFKFLGCRVHGVDGCQYAFSKSLVREDTFYITIIMGLIEHVESKYEKNYMATFEKISKYILLAFAIKGQRGYHHVNTNDSQYWIDLFATIGFKPNYELLQKARSVGINGGFITKEIEEKFPEIVSYKNCKRRKDVYVVSDKNHVFFEKA
jgi:hypothetical protein